MLNENPIARRARLEGGSLRLDPDPVDELIAEAIVMVELASAMTKAMRSKAVDLGPRCRDEKCPVWHICPEGGDYA